MLERNKGGISGSLKFTVGSKVLTKGFSFFFIPKRVLYGFELILLKSIPDSSTFSMTLILD